jgi:hypothetical protein
MGGEENGGEENGAGHGGGHGERSRTRRMSLELFPFPEMGVPSLLFLPSKMD